MKDNKTDKSGQDLKSTKDGENFTQNKTLKEKHVTKQDSEDIRDVYIKEMQEFLGEEPTQDPQAEIDSIPSGNDMNNKGTRESEPHTEEKEYDEVNEDSLKDLTNSNTLLKYEEKIQVSKSNPNPRYEKSFAGSTVEYETFTYDHDEVIKLDEKLHQFLDHLKIADPKVESSMKALGEAKSDVRSSHTQQTSTRTELNDNFMGHLENGRLDDVMKCKHDPSNNTKYDSSSSSDENDSPKLTLMEKLAMLERIQKSVQEEKDALDQKDQKDDESKVDEWLIKQCDQESSHEVYYNVDQPRPSGQTPWEVVENDTISDLSKTFAAVVS